MPVFVTAYPSIKNSIQLLNRIGSSWTLLYKSKLCGRFL